MYTDMRKCDCRIIIDYQYYSIKYHDLNYYIIIIIIIQPLYIILYYYYKLIIIMLITCTYKSDIYYIADQHLFHIMQFSI